MTTPETPEEAIEQNTLGPKRVKVGNQEVEQHSIKDQIAARDALAQSTAVRKNHRGLYFTKLVPPGGG